MWRLVSELKLAVGNLHVMSSFMHLVSRAHDVRGQFTGVTSVCHVAYVYFSDLRGCGRGDTLVLAVLNFRTS